MNEGMDGWMDRWMDGKKNGWMDGQMKDKWRINEWMNGCMDGWLYGCMDGWLYGWMDTCNWWMNGWMDNAQIDQWPWQYKHTSFLRLSWLKDLQLMLLFSIKQKCMSIRTHDSHMTNLLINKKSQVIIVNVW